MPWNCVGRNRCSWPKSYHYSKVRLVSLCPQDSTGPPYVSSLPAPLPLTILVPWESSTTCWIRRGPLIMASHSAKSLTHHRSSWSGRKLNKGNAHALEKNIIMPLCIIIVIHFILFQPIDHKLNLLTLMHLTTHCTRDKLHWSSLHII